MVWRVYCARCNARTVVEGKEAARREAEQHARLGDHWGRVCFWPLTAARRVVRVVEAWGTRPLKQKTC